MGIIDQSKPCARAVTYILETAAFGAYFDPYDRYILGLQTYGRQFCKSAI